MYVYGALSLDQREFHYFDWFDFISRCSLRFFLPWCCERMPKKSSVRSATITNICVFFSLRLPPFSKLWLLLFCFPLYCFFCVFSFFGDYLIVSIFLFQIFRLTQKRRISTGNALIQFFRCLSSEIITNDIEKWQWMSSSTVYIY